MRINKESESIFFIILLNIEYEINNMIKIKIFIMNLFCKYSIFVKLLFKHKLTADILNQLANSLGIKLNIFICFIIFSHPIKNI